MRRQALFSGSKGYIPSQPYIQNGIVDSVFAGENVIRDPQGWRVFGGWQDMNESRTPATYGYTANLTSGSNIAELSVGATAKTDFRARQHLLIGRKLYLIQRIVDDTHLQLSPTPNETLTGETVKKVFVLSALNIDRATQYAGNSVLFRNLAIFSVGDGEVYKMGAAINASLTASNLLQVAYPSDGTFDSRPAGFSKPSAPTVAEGSAGVKNMPAGSYPMALIRKRIGFSGEGNPSDRSFATITVAGNTVSVDLPAFATSEGQTGWIVAGPRPDEIGQANPGLWKWAETDQESATVEFEVTTDEVLERVAYDNDPPPKAGFVFSLANYLVLASAGGAPDSLNAETTPGPELAPSKYNNPEAFSPFARVPTAGGEEILGVQVGQLVAFLMTPNTMQVASLSGNQIAPFAVRSYWVYGFEHQFNGCVAHDRFYATTKKGLHRTVNESTYEAVDDFSWAVRGDFESLDLAREFVGYDPSKEHVVVFHANHQQGSGGGWQTKAWAFNLKTDQWNPPVILGNGTDDFIVTSCRTVAGALYYTTADGKVWQWDEGGQTLSGYLGFCFMAESPQFLKTVRMAKLTGNANTALKIYKDLDAAGLRAGSAAPSKTLAGGGGLSAHQAVWLMNTLCRSFALRVEFSLTDKVNVFDQLECEYQLHPGFRS